MTSEDAERDLELKKCDRELLALQPKIRSGDDAAIRTALQISDRRCKLLGLDGPVEEAISRGVAAELNQLFAVLEQVLTPDEFQRVMAAIARLSDVG